MLERVRLAPSLGKVVERENLHIELMTSDRKIEASREGSK